MGKLIIDSINVLDRPVIVAYLMIIVLMFVRINLVVDLLYIAARSAGAAGGQSDEQPIVGAPPSRLDRAAGRDAVPALRCRTSPHRRLALVGLVVLRDHRAGRAVWRPWIAPQNPYDLAAARHHGRPAAAGLARRRPA